MRCRALDQELSIATAFVYDHNGRTVLITNYHVLSGRSPITGQPLHDSGAVPDSVAIGVPAVEQHEDGFAVRWTWRTMPLYEGDDNQRPIWTEHPRHGKLFDGVAIPLAGWDKTAVRAANSPTLDLDPIHVYPGMDAFVIGYPRGMSGGGRLPIWKRATIATEPEIDIDGLPKLYIDTATREGMSGAPVYAQEVGYWQPEGTTNSGQAYFGKGMRFLGLYSGRLGAEDEFKAQLGIVWKESGLVELAAAVPTET